MPANNFVALLAPGLLLLALAGCANSHSAKTQAKLEPAPAHVTRIGFGSCAEQNKPQPVWYAVNALAPAAFVFLGDNIYADTIDPAVMRKKYARFGAQLGLQRLRQQTQVLATWDDHDYGQNDAGAENPIKEQARTLMMDFWQVAENAPRRTQPGGIYAAHYLNDGDTRVQILLLDLRWNRSPLQTVSAAQYKVREANNQGPYLPQMGGAVQMLGEPQWQWLEEQLQQPAAVRILASSLQLLPEFTGWEAWANFPDERARLFQLLRQHKVNNLFIISGDTHWAEFSEVDVNLAAPLFEATSSGLTEEWHAISPNQHRISDAFAQANFGMVDINWQAQPVQLDFIIYKANGEVLLQAKRQLPAGTQ